MLQGTSLTSGEQRSQEERDGAEKSLLPFPLSLQGPPFASCLSEVPLFLQRRKATVEMIQEARRQPSERQTLGDPLQRSLSQQWIRTPGSSCCWQWRDVAHPLVKRIPRTTAGKRVKKQENRCLKPCWEREQVITSGLEHPLSTDLAPTRTLQP
uniref:Uncharacterized protein n=1 Tax=Sphaerodactylus townsendi TaxID=933632 RepID=A0ACB8F089_9SAUR